jgi:hypothetical protein
MMKKRVRRFDDGGMASSGIQSAFDQPRSTSSGIGLGNNAPLVQIGSETGVGGVRAAPQAYGPLNIGQPVQQQQMRRGGKVKAKTKPKAYAAGGAVKKTRGDGCCQKGKTRGTMR